MIIDLDLDIKNHQAVTDYEGDKEILLYLRADLEDGDFTYAVCGNVVDLTNYLVEIEEAYDVILSAAAYICKTQKIDFNEVMENLKLEEG